MPDTPGDPTDIPPPTDAVEMRAEAQAASPDALKRRVGFLTGQFKIPDDFDTMCQAEIERMFCGDEQDNP